MLLLMRMYHLLLLAASVCLTESYMSPRRRLKLIRVNRRRQNYQSMAADLLACMCKNYKEGNAASGSQCNEKQLWPAAIGDTRPRCPVLRRFRNGHKVDILSHFALSLSSSRKEEGGSSKFRQLEKEETV